jgi:hypothetical protein
MKRKLRLESLTVESFATAPRKADARGTVRGHDSGWNATDAPTCFLACDPGTTGTCQPGWTEVYTSPCCD